MQRINEKPVVVVDYESGRAIPNDQILAKMERTLGLCVCVGGGGGVGVQLLTCACVD